MKYLSEYRDPEMAARFIEEINRITTREWTIMEVCGGQTHSLVKHGILNLLPDKINMVHGPGCPVCVTPINIIDKALALADREDVILCSFGDMLRVPGTGKSLLDKKSEGKDIRILYSPLEAVQIAKNNPDKEVVFFAVGFETTAPANALSLVHARREGCDNYSLLASHVLVPPAIEAIMDDEESVVQAFLAAGHVCTIMGMEEYYPIVKKYNIPIVITGFEPLDLLHGILMTIQQLEKGEAKLENQYARMVRPNGNPNAQDVIYEVFEPVNRMWRGIGTLEQSGYGIKQKYAQYDATKKFDLQVAEVEENNECIAGSIMKGLKKPIDCPNFGVKCNPENPLGAPMVSSEGACAAYYHFSDVISQVS